ncbi:hypothetical protein B296_00059121 [Ensete ventricosum]|uniref:NAC domain-containing protein n=1 Tax=Ensete ventricosum TaxID=4639 RepID=A0A426X530_ENSVE|nr:hypothetical protein B296_00059121 [Ensete ventricosum]
MIYFLLYHLFHYFSFLFGHQPPPIDGCCYYSLSLSLSLSWYFFSYKDRKYPSGTRTNRGTAAGFWKATREDKPVISSSRVIGLRKTIAFYKGRAPNGRQVRRLHHSALGIMLIQLQGLQEEGWVVCRESTPKRQHLLKRPCDSNVSATYNNSLETTVTMRGYFFVKRELLAITSFHRWRFLKVMRWVLRGREATVMGI